MYKELNDNELLYLVSERNEDVYNILYYKYQPLIYKTVIKYLKTARTFGYDLDDLMQVGYISLYRSICLFNEKNDAIFYTYLKSAIEKSIMSEIRNNTTNKKMMLNLSVSYDNIIDNTDITFIDTIEDKKSFINYLNLEKMYIEFKNSLSFTDSNIFELKYYGLNNNEIASFLSTSLSYVSNRIGFIKRRALTLKYLFFN